MKSSLKFSRKKKKIREGEPFPWAHSQHNEGRALISHGRTTELTEITSFARGQKKGYH